MFFAVGKRAPSLKVKATSRMAWQQASNDNILWIVSQTYGPYGLPAIAKDAELIWHTSSLTSECMLQLPHSAGEPLMRVPRSKAMRLCTTMRCVESVRISRTKANRYLKSPAIGTPAALTSQQHLFHSYFFGTDQLSQNATGAVPSRPSMSMQCKGLEACPNHVIPFIGAAP